MKGFPYKVKEHLEKSIDSALLAVEIYNKPAVKFKSAGYIILMTVAWTSLFHAIFFIKKIKPFYKLTNGRFDRKAGDIRYWELGTCIDNYFGDDSQNPIRVNLKFFIPLRNKIEHRSMPEIDPNIFAECQAMLLNFDEIIEREFGIDYCIRESLSFSLQLFPSRQNLNSAILHNPKNKQVVDFINSYRSSISTEVLGNTKYAFKAYLIQVANHLSNDALPIQFYHWDKLSDAQKDELGKFVAMIKYKNVPITQLDLFKPNEIVKIVQKSLGNLRIDKMDFFNKKIIATSDKFNLKVHTLCWKKYKVRPECNSTNPGLTDPKYCFYDKLNKNYGYTKDWANFLIEKLCDENEYKSLFKSQSEAASSSLIEVIKQP